MDYGRALKAEILMTNKPELNVPYLQPALDAIALFEELRIGYALVGGVAAMYYGRPRFTEDIDFVAATGHGEVLSAHPEALERHHFAADCTYKLHHQSGVQVDVWKDEFTDDVVNRSIEVPIGGRTCRLVEPHDLIAMKLRAHRLKDDYDVLEIFRHNPIDEKRLRSLVTVEQFTHFESIKLRT